MLSLSMHHLVKRNASLVRALGGHTAMEKEEIIHNFEILF